jgi:hypothetical protein
MGRRKEMIQMKIDKEALERVEYEIQTEGRALTLKDIVDVFGWPAMELIILLVIHEDNTKNIEQLLVEIKHEIKFGREK